MMRDFHYAWPWAANFLLGVGIVLIFSWLLYRYRKKQILDCHFVAPVRFWGLAVLQAILASVLWVFAVFALMQPLANGHYPGGSQQTHQEPLRRPSHTVILLMDGSASMNVADMHSGQTRFAYAKELADELIGNLEGEQLALFGFTSDLIALSPPTLDYLFVRMMLSEWAVDKEENGGTDIYAVLADLRKRLQEMPEMTIKTIVLFSDGGDTAIQESESAENVKLKEALLGLVTDNLKLNVRTYTVGVGSLRGGVVPDVVYQGKTVDSRLNASLLKEIAAAGRGKFLDASDYTVVDASQQLAKEINQLSKGAQDQDIGNSQALEDNSLIYDHYFQIPLAIAVAALIGWLYLPTTIRKMGIVLWIVGSTSLQGEERPPGEVFYEARQYPRATAAVDDLSGLNLTPWQREVLRYNKGTIFLAQKEWDQAIAAFTASSVEGLPPTLASNLLTNLGIAYLEKARALRQASPPFYSMALALQEEAMDRFRQADQIEMGTGDSHLLLKIAAVDRALTLEQKEKETSAGESQEEGSSLLENLLMNYKRALRQEQLTRGVLIALQLEQQKALENKQENQANERLKKSLEALRQEKQVDARFYLESAQESVRRLLVKESSETPKALLKELLERETSASRLLRLKRQMDEKEGEELVKQAQKDVLSTASLFMPNVLEFQTKIFRGNGTHRCQGRPWNEVLVLFEKGRKSAKTAESFLDKKAWQSGLQNEAKALIEWGKALAVLEQPVLDNSSPCETEQPKKNQQDESKQEEKSQPEIRQVLRVLQELNKGDQLPKTNTGIKKQGSKPW